MKEIKQKQFEIKPLLLIEPEKTQAEKLEQELVNDEYEPKSKLAIPQQDI